MEEVPCYFPAPLDPLPVHQRLGLSISRCENTRCQFPIGWCMLVCAGACWCVLVCAGVCWCVLVCAGVCEPVLKMQSSGWPSLRRSRPARAISLITSSDLQIFRSSDFWGGCWAEKELSGLRRSNPDLLSSVLAKCHGAAPCHAVDLTGHVSKIIATFL